MDKELKAYTGLTDAQLRASRHNWLRKRYAGALSAIQAVAHADTATDEVVQRARSVMAELLAINELLKERRDG